MMNLDDYSRDELKNIIIEIDSNDFIESLSSDYIKKNKVQYDLIEERELREICTGNVGHKSVALKQRQKGNPPEVIAYADKANERLRRRFYKMTLNKGVNRNVATTAIARELACFIWGMMTEHVS